VVCCIYRGTRYCKLVQAPFYKPEDRGFDSGCHWVFFNWPNLSSLDSLSVMKLHYQISWKVVTYVLILGTLLEERPEVEWAIRQWPHACIFRAWQFHFAWCVVAAGWDGPRIQEKSGTCGQVSLPEARRSTLTQRGILLLLKIASTTTAVLPYMHGLHKYKPRFYDCLVSWFDKWSLRRVKSACLRERFRFGDLKPRDWSL
jgi:hypothetical protein